MKFLNFILIVSLLTFVACTESRQLNLLRSADELIAQGNYPLAYQKLKKAISLNPESKTAIKALYKIGFISETYMKDIEGALFNYNEFLKLSQDKIVSYEIQKRIASIYFDNELDPEKTIIAYKKLIEMNPQSLEVDFFYLRIAQSFFSLNNFEQARYEFQKLIEKFPKSQYVAKAKFEIGNTYFIEGKYTISIEALKQVVRNYPQSEYMPEAQFIMAQCLEEMGSFEESLRILESLQGRYPAKEVLKMRILAVQKKKKKPANG